jgi:hypothetical protein
VHGLPSTRHTLAVQRIRTSWELGKISWGVLRSDRSLAWFPVLSLIGSLIVVGIFGGLIAATGYDSNGANEGLKGIGYVFVVCAYIGLALVGTYFQSALTAGANERLNGRDSNFGTSIAAANSKLHRILPWALVQATVSIVIAAVEERAGWVGQILVRLLGAAWQVVTFLTIPIIVLEDLGPWNALKRSGTLLKQTWGENLIGQAGFGLLALVAMLPGAAFVGIGIATGTLVAAIPLVAIGVVMLLIALVIIQAMSGIYRTALYRFAVDGKAPPAFAGADLSGAFTKRGARRGFGAPSSN